MIQTQDLAYGAVAVGFQWICLLLQFRAKSNKTSIFWGICNLILMVVAFWAFSGGMHVQ